MPAKEGITDQARVRMTYTRSSRRSGVGGADLQNYYKLLHQFSRVLGFKSNIYSTSFLEPPSALPTRVTFEISSHSLKPDCTKSSMMFGEVTEKIKSYLFSLQHVKIDQSIKNSEKFSSRRIQNSHNQHSVVQCIL